MSSTSIDKVLFGLKLIQDIFGELTIDSVRRVSEIAAGVHEDAIKAALTYRIALVDTEGDNDLFISQQYVKLVNRCKYICQEIINEANVLTRINKDSERLERMSALSRKHSQGTTAELAEMLGMSKSKVRKLKADGQLDSVIAMTLGMKDIEDKEIQNGGECHDIS